MTGLLVVWAIFAAVGWGIGARKGRPKAGLLCGALLGIVGDIIAAFLRSASELDHVGATYIDKPKGPQKYLGESAGAFQARSDAYNDLTRDDR